MRRAGNTEPVYLEKSKVYEIKDLNLWNTSYVVAPGHALRFAVSSSNWPRFSVNPNNGLLLKDPAYPGVNTTATNTLYHSSMFASYVTLPVVTRVQLPEVHVLKEAQKAYPHLTDVAVAKFAKGFDTMLTRMKKQKK